MQKRLKNLRAFLKKNNLDAAFLSSPAILTYLSACSFAIQEDREAYLFITEKNQYIISSHLYKNALRKSASDFIFIDFFSEEEGIFWKKLQTIIKEEQILSVGFEENNLTVEEYQAFLKYHKKLIGLSFEEIREKKDAQEIQAIKEACAITDAALTALLPHITQGLTEKNIAYLLEDFMRKNGAEPSFSTIVAFGENAAVPHHATGETRLPKRSLILLDFGVKVDNYCSDMTRTIFLGQPTTEEKKAYLTVQKSQQDALDFLQKNTPPVAAKKVDAVSRKVITRQGYPSFQHGLGHSIGINVHDGFGISPYSENMLENNMVFSVEPGIYLAEKFGIRIEDTVAFVNNKLEILTTSTKEIVVL